MWPSVCQVTYLVQAQLGGSLPQAVLNTRIKSTLSTVHRMQDKFARNGKVVDEQVRAALGKLHIPEEDEVTPEQLFLYRQSRALEEGADPSAPPGSPGSLKRGNVRGSVRGTIHGSERWSERGSVRSSARRRRKAAGASVRSALGLRSKQSTWLDLPTPSPFVTMGMQYKPTVAGQNPIVLAEAQTVVDCGIEEAYAWFMVAAGRERTRHHLEHGDLAHVTLNDRSVHDRTVATIHKTPFRLTNREYVVRSLGVMKADNFNPSLNVALTSEEVGKVDYGQSFRVIRGHLTGLIRLEDVREGGTRASRVTFTVQWSGEGNLPPWAMRNEIVRTLSVANELRTEVQRDDEIDAAERAKLAKVMTKNQQTYSREDNATLNLSLGYFNALGDAKFQDLESPDVFVQMEWALDDGESLLRASATVDATVEDCAAFETAKMSRGEQQRHFEEKGLERSLVRVNAHSSTFHMVRRLDFPGAQPREWLVRSVWKWKDERKEEMALSCETLDNNEEYPADPSFAKVKFACMWVFKRLKKVGRVDQTLMTVTMRVDLGGYIPQSAVRRLGVQQLIGVSLLRRQFDKSLEVDGAVRAENMKMIAEHDTVYGTYERVCLFRGEQQFVVSEGSEAKSLKMASPLTTAEIAFEKKGSRAWGRATTTVRASPEEVLAFMWDAVRRSARREDDLERSLEEQANGHNKLVYNKKRTPKIIADRDFLSRYVWKKEDEGFLLVTIPEESENRIQSSFSGVGRALSGVLPASIKSREERVVRGKYPSAMRIQRKNDKETTVEYVLQIDFGGSLPTWLTNSYVGSSACYVTEIQEHFQELRKLEDYDADDGKALGVRLMHPGTEKGKKPWRKVKDVVGKHRALKELSVEFDWLVGFLEEVVRGKWVRSGSVSTKLECLSEKEARKIGRSLMPALKQRKTALAGLHQWKMQNRSMVELFERYDWVESMLLEVAQEVMKTAPWGLMWRVCTGATLSVLDIVTDVVVIVGYMEKEETRGYGNSLMMMLAGSMVLQLGLVFLQNRKKSWVMAKEMLVVITGLKAPW